GCDPWVRKLSDRFERGSGAFGATTRCFSSFCQLSSTSLKCGACPAELTIGFDFCVGLGGGACGGATGPCDAVIGRNVSSVAPALARSTACLIFSIEIPLRIHLKSERPGVL